jgi:hypothetical protein
MNRGIKEDVKKTDPGERQKYHYFPMYDHQTPILSHRFPHQRKQDDKGNGPSPECQANRGNDLCHTTSQYDITGPAKWGDH